MQEQQKTQIKDPSQIGRQRADHPSTRVLIPYFNSIAVHFVYTCIAFCKNSNSHLEANVIINNGTETKQNTFITMI